MPKRQSIRASKRSKRKRGDNKRKTIKKKITSVKRRSGGNLDAYDFSCRTPYWGPSCL